MKVNKVTAQYTRNRQTWGNVKSYPVHRGAQLDVEYNNALGKDLLPAGVGDPRQGNIRHPPPFPIFGQYVLTDEVRASSSIQHGPHGE